MSMTLVNAKIYVARIIGGGANSQESLDQAGEAIQRTYLEWQAKKFWRFLLKDTSQATAVSATATKSSAVVNAPTAGALDFVNLGQTVTYSGAAGTLAASTTVLTVTRGSDGVVTSVTLSNAMGGGAYTTETGTFTFSAHIPIRIGTNDYALPNDFNAPFTARFLVNFRTLAYRDQRWWDRTIINQDIQGTPIDYTVYNTYSALTQNYGTMRLKFDRIPAETDTMLLRYYRKFNVTGTSIDIPDDFLYQFLDYARNILLETKRAQDDPAGYGASVRNAAEMAEQDDEQVTDDDDLEVGLKSQYEVGLWNRNLWNNGSFDATP